MHGEVYQPFIPENARHQAQRAWRWGGGRDRGGHGCSLVSAPVRFWVPMSCICTFKAVESAVFDQRISFFIRDNSMANSAQARKRARQAVKQRAHNASLRSTLRTAVKRVQKAIVAGDKAAAQSIYQESVSVIDRIADKKIVHKNKAARHKSRLSAQIKALAA